jgi:hypothetical protein
MLSEKMLRLLFESLPSKSFYTDKASTEEENGSYRIFSGYVDLIFINKVDIIVRTVQRIKDMMILPSKWYGRLGDVGANSDKNIDF